MSETIEQILGRALQVDASQVAWLLGEALEHAPLGADAKAKGQAVLARLNRLLAGRTVGGALEGEPLEAVGPDDADVDRRLDEYARTGKDPGPR